MDFLHGLKFMFNAAKTDEEYRVWQEKIREKVKDIKDLKTRSAHYDVLTCFHELNFFDLNEICEKIKDTCEYDTQLYEDEKIINGQVKQMTTLLEKIELDKIEKYESIGFEDLEKAQNRLTHCNNEVAAQMENRSFVKKLRTLQEQYKTAVKVETQKQTEKRKLFECALQRRNKVVLKFIFILIAIKKFKAIKGRKQEDNAMVEQRSSDPQEEDRHVAKYNKAFIDENFLIRDENLNTELELGEQLNETPEKTICSDHIATESAEKAEESQLLTDNMGEDCLPNESVVLPPRDNSCQYETTINFAQHINQSESSSDMSEIYEVEATNSIANMNSVENQGSGLAQALMDPQNRGKTEHITSNDKNSSKTTSKSLKIPNSSIDNENFKNNNTMDAFNTLKPNINPTLVCISPSSIESNLSDISITLDSLKFPDKQLDIFENSVNKSKPLESPPHSTESFINTLESDLNVGTQPNSLIEICKPSSGCTSHLNSESDLSDISTAVDSLKLPDKQIAIFENAVNKSKPLMVPQQLTGSFINSLESDLHTPEKSLVENVSTSISKDFAKEKVFNKLGCCKETSGNVKSAEIENIDGVLQTCKSKNENEFTSKDISSSSSDEVANFENKILTDIKSVQSSEKKSTEKPAEQLDDDFRPSSENVSDLETVDVLSAKSSIDKNSDGNDVLHEILSASDLSAKEENQLENNRGLPLFDNNLIENPFEGDDFKDLFFEEGAYSDIDAENETDNLDFNLDFDLGSHSEMLNSPKPSTTEKDESNNNTSNKSIANLLEEKEIADLLSDNDFSSKNVSDGRAAVPDLNFDFDFDADHESSNDGFDDFFDQPGQQTPKKNDRDDFF